MSTAKELHRQAMVQADLWHTAAREGNAEAAAALLLEAFHLERSAAEQLTTRYDAEPSRSILFRSAATLAIRAQMFSEAEQMICLALAGTPQAEVAEELRDLFEQVNFSRHLAIRGVVLSDNEVQMSLGGRGVGFGIAPTDEVIERIERAQSMLYRFAERRLQRPYREKGQPPKDVKQSVSLFMTVPRAASFAVSLVVGGLQQTLPGMSVGESVIDEVIECLDLFVKEEEEQLQERIPDEAYRTNFKALAKAMAPDGAEIETVGFTALREGRPRTVALKPVKRKEATSQPSTASVTHDGTGPGETVITGTLKFADSLEHRQDQIKLVDANGSRYTVVVPPGMMADIVRPLWGSLVTVTGTMKRRQIELTDIVKARE
jgi:hypothetical protein